MFEQVGEAAHDGEPQAEALRAVAFGVIELDELLEDGLLGFRRDAGAVVADFDAHLAAAFAAGHQDGAAGGVAQGVADEVVQDALEQLFGVRSLTETVRPGLPEVPAQLAAMQAMLEAMSAPGITPDEHCQSPYECPFWNHCIENKPARWIYHLPGSSKTVVHLRELGVRPSMRFQIPFRSPRCNGG